MIADTAGGLLCRPHDPSDLANKLADLLLDPLRATQLGLTGQQSIQDRYHARSMAQQTRDLYRRLVPLPA
jgi:glycosyltransferase involved in cell wall biosynthesis